MIDISKLKSLVLSELKPPMSVTLVTPTSGLPELSSFITEKLNTNGLLGLDTETNWCNDFFFRKVRTIQVGDKERQFVIDLLTFAGTSEKLSEAQGHYTLDACFRPIFDILSPALCSNKTLKVGQNLSFEYTVLLWNFGQRIWNLYSTDLAERVIQAGRISLKRMTEFSMAAIVARRFGLIVDKEQQDKFDLESPLTKEMIDYAAFDTRMPLSMRESQLREMTVDQLLATAQIENDALGAFADMHLNGLKLDSTRWMKRVEALIERRKEELKFLDTEFIKKVGRKDSQIDFVEMERREKLWRENFEAATEAEMLKAEAIRGTRDNAQKAVLRVELDALKKERAAKKAEARKSYLELQKKFTEFKNEVDKMEGDAYINYASNDQLLEALKMFKGMGTLNSVGDDQLLKYNDRPFIQTLRKYRKGKKATGTYGKQWTETWITGPGKKIEGTKDDKEGWVHPFDGRIHATWNQLEAETGRSSSQKPSVMNLPKEDEVRACFICDPPDENIRVSCCCDSDTTQITGDWVCTSCGKPCETKAEEYCLVTTDMSGAELRIIAELADAISWIRAFEKGQDVHSVSTEILEPEKWLAGRIEGCLYYAIHDEESVKKNPLGVVGEQRKEKCSCPEHKELRDHTKAINFLLCYGGGPDALADELDITVDAAKELMAKHEAAFPDVWGYLKKSGLRAQATNEARDLYGRRRSLPAPTWESAKEYYKDEHADRLKLPEDVQKRSIFNFTATYLRKPNAEEKYKLTHREPSEGEIRSAMRGLHGSIGRRGKNHCIQGSNASIIKRSMGAGFDKNNVPYLWHTLPKLKAKLLSMIHDELLIQCPKRYAEKVARAVADAFKRAAAEVMSKVVMEAEWHIADRWQK